MEIGEMTIDDELTHAVCAIKWQQYRLRAVDSTDLPLFLQLFCSAQVQRFNAAIATEAAVESMLQRCLTSQTTQRSWVIEHLQQGAVGLLSVFNIKRSDAARATSSMQQRFSGDVGILLVPQAQTKGVGRALFALFCQQLLHKHFNELRCRIHLDNQAAQHMVLRAGFVQGPQQRQWLNYYKTTTGY